MLCTNQLLFVRIPEGFYDKLKEKSLTVSPRSLEICWSVQASLFLMLVQHVCPKSSTGSSVTKSSLSCFQLLLYLQAVTTDGSSTCRIWLFFKCPMSFLTYPQRDQCPLPGSNWDILFISQVNHITIEPPVEPRKIQHFKKKILKLLSKHLDIQKCLGHVPTSLP